MVRKHMSLCGLVLAISGLVGASIASQKGGVNLRFSLGKKTDEKPVTITVSGRITDAKTGKPIAGALVRGHVIIWRNQGPELFDKCPTDEARSDKQGGYKLTFTTPLTTSGPMKGKDCACVYASAPGFETRPRYVIPRVSPDKTAFRDIDVALHPGKLLRGKVVDEQNRPIEGAVVSVQGGMNGDWSYFLSLGRTVTNPDGTFEFRCSTDKAVVGIRPWLRVRKRGYGMGRFWGILEKETMGPLVLPRGGTVTGRVIDPSGKGVPNCEVIARAMMANRIDWTMTDKDGSYVLTGIPGDPSCIEFYKEKNKRYMKGWGEVTVYARHVRQISLRDVPQYQILAKDGKTIRGPDLVIGAPASVSGKVLPSKSTYGLEGLLVRLDAGWDHMVEVDGAGQFHFPYVRPGKHKLTAYLPNNLRGDRGIGRAEINVKRGESVTDVKIQLETLTEVRVQIVDADGNPLEGVTAGATWTRTGHGFWTEGTRSDADGRAVVWLYPGQVQYVHGFDHSEKSLVAENCEVVKPRIGQVINNIRIVMLPTAVIRGRLLTSANVPIATTQAVCKLKFAGKNEDQKRIMTDAAGRFVITRVVPGLATLEIETQLPEYQGQITDGIQIKPGEEKDLGDVVLEPVKFYRISGKLIASPTFDSLKGFKIRTGLRSWEPLVTSDAQGRFVVTKARAGRNRLTAYLPHNLRTDRGVGHTYVTVKDRDVDGVKLQLEALTRIPVRITDEAGRPLKGIAAAAWWTEDHSGVFTEGTKSDKQGKAMLYLYPGSRQYLGAHDWDGRYTLKAHKEIIPIPGNVKKVYHVVMTKSKAGE